MVIHLDRNNIEKIAHTPEDRMLLAKVWDKIQAGLRRDIPASTCFLSPRELEMTRYLFGDLPGLAARIYGKDQDQVFATVRDNLTCYADVSALPVQARNHLAQELLVGYHEGCRKA